MTLDLSEPAAVAAVPKRNLLAEGHGRDYEEFDRLACAAKQYVAALYLSENPECERLYDQLQSAADLPANSESLPQNDYKVIWEALATTPQLLALGYCRMHTTLLENQARQHLVLGQHENLFLQLQQSMEEVEECRLKIKQIAGEVALKERSAAMGQIKQELRYRLGDTLVSCSRSLGGWFRMPFALIGEIRQKGNATRGLSKEKTPSKEAKKELAIKQQLSYRLGCKLVKHARSPIGWILMPFALARETVAFKRKRRSEKSVAKTETETKTSHNNGGKQTK